MKLFCRFHSVQAVPHCRKSLLFMLQSQIFFEIADTLPAAGDIAQVKLCKLKQTLFRQIKAKKTAAKKHILYALLSH